jgi:hypothetical protein
MKARKLVMLMAFIVLAGVASSGTPHNVKAFGTPTMKADGGDPVPQPIPFPKPKAVSA